MFKQATVEDIAHNRITKIHGHIVVVTRYYPRFLKRQRIHEYVPVLAPPKELLHDFKKAEEKLGDHDQGFASIDYESRFELGIEGDAELARLAEMAQTTDVYLVCHCKIGQYCHRELLMILAEARHGTRIARLSHPYTVFRARLPAKIQES
jgi:uncharacterized protein YeaO (DUF488 family)